ncbi:hypothetical protein [Sphingopyxis sp.]|uniref:hypothetical protein n=1 Tax=Sphingopyxis sp. TaxID=1908224 RepID=UPI003BA979D7
MTTKLLLLIAGATLAATPAFAQREVRAANANPFDRTLASNTDESASRNDDDTAPKIEPIAAQAMYNFAGCVVEASRSGAVKLLSKDYRSKEYQDDIRKIAKGHDRCAANSRLGFSGLVFAGNLAEHLLADQFTVAALSADLGRDRSAAPIAARSTLESISMCVVMTAPQQSAAMFRTEVMSDAERDAMKALAPQLSSCIKQGTEFRTNRVGLRALMALAAYRVAVTSKEGFAG